jgi:hypothetical protein
MAIEFREILDDELEVAKQILDAAYGPSAARAGRLRRYRSLDPTTWLLALDDGEPVGLGGAIDYGTVRLFHGEARGNRMTEARAMLREDLAAVSELDRRVGAADRFALLSAYFDEYEARAFVVHDDRGEISGFAFAQDSVVGPWVAESDAATEAALDAALACTFDEPLMIVVPGQNTAAASMLERRGFASMSQLVHMRLGEVRAPPPRPHLRTGEPGCRVGHSSSPLLMPQWTNEPDDEHRGPVDRYSEAPGPTERRSSCHRDRLNTAQICMSG